MNKQIAWTSAVLLGAAVGCGGSSGATPSGAASMSASMDFKDLQSASGDLNGDGYQDLAVLTVPTDPLGSRHAYVTVYYGPFPQGSLPAASEHFDTAASASSVAIADVDGDGTPDVIVGQRCTFGPHGAYLGRVEIFFRAPAGGVSGLTEGLLGLDATSVGVADIDGDGKADLLAASSGYLYLARGVGGRAFAAPGHVPTSGVWTIRKSGHGGADLAVARWTDPSVVDLYRWDSGSLQQSDAIHFARPVTTLAAVDLNGDGIEDVLAGTAQDAAGSVAVALSRNPSTFDPASETMVGPVRQIAVGDFDGDGKRDIVVSGFDADGSVACLLGLGDGCFRAGGTLVPSSPGALQNSADLDGDGKSDLILCTISARVYFSPEWLTH